VKIKTPSVTVCICPKNTPDPACLRAVSSRQSDQQQKKPDGQMHSASSFRNWHAMVGQW